MAFSDIPPVNSAFVVTDTTDSGKTKVVTVVSYSDTDLAVKLKFVGGGTVWVVVADADTDYVIIDTVTDTSIY